MPNIITLVLFIFAIICIFVFVLIIKLRIKILNQRYSDSTQGPSFEEMVRQHQREYFEKHHLPQSKEAFRLVDTIKDPILRKGIRNYLTQERVGKRNWKLSGTNAINIVKDMVEYDRDNPTMRSENQDERLKKLKRFMDLCLEAWTGDGLGIREFERIGDEAILCYFNKKVVEYHTVGSDIYRSSAFLDALTSTLKKYICFDCEQVNPKFCSKGHCLNCANNSKKCSCPYCAKLLDYEICHKCHTIKPAKDTKGRCLKCHKLAGDDICWKCLTIKPDRCMYCNACVNCRGGYSSVFFNICYLCDYDDD